MFSLVVIDDEAYVITSLRKYIEQQHPQFEITGTFSSAEDALSFLRSNPTDVIITDIRMPHMDGLEMLQQVRQFLPDACILVISGYSEFEYAKKACSFNVRNYLLKPIDFQELSANLDAIAKFLSRSSNASYDAQTSMKKSSAPSNTPPSHGIVSNVGVEDDSVIQYAMNYIRTHYADNISRETVANAIYLDGAYFSRLFKQKTGQSYIDFLTEVRMQKAIELLSTQMSITDISSAVGYSHRNQFISNFRKYTGYTPNDYRSQVLLKGDSR